MNSMSKNKFWIQLTILVVIISAIYGCKLGPGEEKFPVPWGGIINRDGTGLEFLFPYQLEARFTEASDGIVYVRSGGINTERGIFVRHLDGTTEKLSDVFTKVDKISRDLNYIFWKEDDIYISDIEGNNKINVTNNPELTYIDPSFSHDSKWLTFVSINPDTLSTINLLNLETFELSKIMEDSPETFYQPKYDTIGNVYYFQVVESHMEIRRYVISNQTFIEYQPSYSINPTSNIYLSGSGTAVLVTVRFLAIDYINPETNELYFVASNISRKNSLLPLGISADGRWMAYDDNGLVILFDLVNFESFQITQGYAPILSPDGEKIFFLKERI